MARVFLSYRRADGRYAVGWIAERLRNLGDVAVTSAFKDGDLRCGDKFPEILAEQIEGCEVLVAVIGPHWLGTRDDGTHRIQDESDWVRREVSIAIEAGKLVLPVLVGGIEALDGELLPPDLAPLVDFHAVEFRDETDLNSVVANLRSHLGDIDKERARTAGLDEPIDILPYRPRPKVVALMAVAALLGAVAGLLLTTALPGDGESVEAFQANDGLWVGAVMLELAVWGALGVLGHFFLWTRVTEVVKVRWQPVLLTFGGLALAVAWAVAAFATPPPLALGSLRTWLITILGLLLLAPWLLTMLGAGWTEPTVEDHELGKRARLIGQLDRTGLLAAAVIAGSMTPPAAAAAGLGRALERSGVASRATAIEVSFALVLTGLLVTGLAWSRTQLRNDSTKLLEGSLKTLGSPYLKHATDVLIGDDLGLRRPWLLAWLAVPVATAVVLAVLL